MGLFLLSFLVGEIRCKVILIKYPLHTCIPLFGMLEPSELLKDFKYSETLGNR
jgi:hypothetical protein